jgi:hypothetical protein
MKNWQPEDWIKFIGICIVGYCLSVYFTGMFILKQATTDQNRDLRMALVILLTTIVNNILNKRQ